MGEAALIDIARVAIIAYLKAGVPVMLIALGVGFAVSLAQALTQIQEQTLVYVPKIVAVFGALLLLLPMMGDTLARFMAEIAQRIVTGAAP
jgi:flagellar biosynthetic protein FliQ